MQEETRDNAFDDDELLEEYKYNYKEREIILGDDNFYYLVTKDEQGNSIRKKISSKENFEFIRVANACKEVNLRSKFLKTPAVVSGVSGGVFLGGAIVGGAALYTAKGGALGAISSIGAGSLAVGGGIITAGVALFGAVCYGAAQGIGKIYKKYKENDIRRNDVLVSLTNPKANVFDKNNFENDSFVELLSFCASRPIMCRKNKIKQFFLSHGEQSQDAENKSKKLREFLKQNKKILKRFEKLKNKKEKSDNDLHEIHEIRNKLTNNFGIVCDGLVSEETNQLIKQAKEQGKANDAENKKENEKQEPQQPSAEKNNNNEQPPKKEEENPKVSPNPSKQAAAVSR
ncbi:MAG: hypothetical protein LBC92_00535 [Rickettsiales bacterium]|jgi:hypothetical protein|nr:hypothetical protein [Rickettsiales bacterium]